MSEEIENEKVERRDVKEREAEGPLAGERLAAARREQQITVLEIAKELHLDEPKVRALEQNDFELLGAPVFAKGHLRKYASLVKVDIDDVLQDYYRLNRASGIPPVVGKVRKPAREMSPGPWIATIIILIIAAAAYWWFLGADTPPSVPESRPAAEEPQTPDFGETGVIDVLDEATTVYDEGTTDNETEFATQVVEMPEQVVIQDAPPQQTSTAVAVGQVRLTMTFSGDCWTEVSDANGRRLYFDLGQEGRSANVTGEAPLSVLFGNAENVSLRVNGSDYAISPADRRGETARLTIRRP